MKKNIIKILLISILSVISAPSKANCDFVSFKENYLNNFQKDEVFFIKGVALDVFEYGRTIEVIEDLKGDFTGESSIFVWGAGNPPSGCMTIERWDIITRYQENDTLIMLVYPVVYENCLETFGDYTTITCAFSVLKLSNDSVTGHIYPWGDLWGETTMPWKELQKLLLESTATQPIKTRNSIYQWNGTIFFENPENKAIKLSFYDLFGRLVHEAVTTSNSYRPILTGNIFVCRINMNNELQTIKYIVR